MPMVKEESWPSFQKRNSNAKVVILIFVKLKTSFETSLITTFFYFKKIEMKTTISFDILVYATGTLLASIFNSESIVSKTSLDLIADKILYVETLLTIKTVKELKCFYFCDRLTKNKRNLRKYTEESETCETLQRQFEEDGQLNTSG